MNSTSIQLSDDYILHVTVQPVAMAPGQFHLQIESQWLGAKNPDGRQTCYSVTLPQRKVFELAALLIEGAT